MNMRDPDAMEMAKRVGIAYHAWHTGAVLTNRQETDLYLSDRTAWLEYREQQIAAMAFREAA